MRRRPREVGPNDMPLRLRRFDRSEWSDAECHPECAFWDAREEWRDEHPIDLDHPGDLELAIDGPDVPIHPEWT